MQGAVEAPGCVIPFPYYTWALIHVPCPLLTQPLRRKHLLKVLSLAKVLRALPQNAQSRMTTQVLRVRGATIPAVHYLAAERRTECTQLASCPPHSLRLIICTAGRSPILRCHSRCFCCHVQVYEMLFQGIEDLLQAGKAADSDEVWSAWQEVVGKRVRQFGEYELPKLVHQHYVRSMQGGLERVDSHFLDVVFLQQASLDLTGPVQTGLQASCLQGAKCMFEPGQRPARPGASPPTSRQLEARVTNAAARPLPAETPGGAADPPGAPGAQVQAWRGGGGRQVSCC